MTMATLTEEQTVQTLDIRREEMIDAPIEIVFQAMLDELGPESQMPGGQPFPLKHLNEVSARVPYLCKVAPAGKYHMEDVYRAGGINAILKTLAGKPGTLDVNAGKGRKTRASSKW